MDAVLECRYFIDLDRYRQRRIDWEAVAIALSACDLSIVIMAGWFTIDVPQSFDEFQKGYLKGNLFRYDGGSTQSLSEFLLLLDPL